MTQALHELNAMLDKSHEREDIDEAHILDELSQQFKATNEQIVHDHEVTPAELEDIREAHNRLTEELGHVALDEMVSEMDAAIASGNPELKSLARQTLHNRFPQNPQIVPDPGLRYANKTTVDTYELAMERAEENGTLVSSEVARAGAIIDQKAGMDFDDVIKVSNWSAKEQHGDLDEQDKLELEKARHELDEVRRREEERQKLEDLDQLNNKDFDDAVAYDPFADDEDDEAA